MSDGITITFPGGQRVDADMGGFIVKTDQNGSAPPPFALFLASLGTCAGIYVLSFCQSRGLPTDGITLTQRVLPNPATGGIGRIEIDINVPPGFPENYHEALVRVANKCAVKKAISEQPEIMVKTVVKA